VVAVPSASGSTGNRPRTSRASQVTLRLLAMLVFAQAVFAGLFLDGKPAWRDWHAINGMLVHVPLGVAILGLVGALLARTRDLARGVPGLPTPGDDPADAGDHRRHRHPAL
jgi:hypothetical protein